MHKQIHTAVVSHSNQKQLWWAVQRLALASGTEPNMYQP